MPQTNTNGNVVNWNANAFLFASFVNSFLELPIAVLHPKFFESRLQSALISSSRPTTSSCHMLKQACITFKLSALHTERPEQ